MYIYTPLADFDIRRLREHKIAKVCSLTPWGDLRTFWWLATDRLR